MSGTAHEREPRRDARQEVFSHLVLLSTMTGPHLQRKQFVATRVGCDRSGI
jgi:hypothetical protein